MFDVVHDDRLFAPGGHEDLDGFVVIAVGALVERTLNAVVSLGLTYFEGITKVFVLTLPFFNC